MYRKNANQQINLSDRTTRLTDRELRFLSKSWAKVFAEEIFPRIGEDRFRVLYSEETGRPPTPVNVVIGAMIIKEMFGDSDEELLEALLFDIRYQYALCLTSFD
ncbi:MAG: transposase, partial [Symbiobacteriaceae bacterium]|nr:transposase [Symbiobacteriaceae bacterium]